MSLALQDRKTRKVIDYEDAALACPCQNMYLAKGIPRSCSYVPDEDLKRVAP